MHTDARQLPADTLIEGDLCIIGAGAAGISMAMDWIGTPHKVILLEGGGFDYDPQIQELYDGKTSGQPYYPLKSARLHYFGGTTGHWAGFCAPFDPIDFEKRDWVPYSGWPISLKDLEPYYPRAQKILELGPYHYDWRFFQKQHPEWKSILPDESVVWNKLWQFSPPTRFGTRYRERILNARNIHLYTYANVVDITANETVQSVSHVTCSNFTGKTCRVKARHYILACSTIQNARMLLASNKQAPAGLGNDHDLVGRFFMEHIEIKTAELWLTEPNPMSLYSFDFGKTKARCELAITRAMQEKYRILNGTSSLTPLQIAKNQKPMIELWDTKDPQKNMRQMEAAMDKPSSQNPMDKGQSLYRSYELFTRIEQAPNPESRITLDTQKDALGVPRANLHWVLTPLEKHSIRKIYELIGQQIGLTDAGRVRMKEFLWDLADNSWPDFTGGGWHHMGTTRMSEDPKRGVVTPHCRVHGINNLHVAGAACYVTAAAPNPTLTLVTLTLRLSDHLKTLMA